MIEAALSSSGVDKLDFYRPLGMPEVWIWENEMLNVFILEDGDYELSSESRLLPGWDLTLVARFADQAYTSEALDAFEEALNQA